jgi:hypothetical protein
VKGGPEGAWAEIGAGAAAPRALSGIQETLGYKASHLFKRLTIIEQQFGDDAHHLGLLMRSAA